jgi:4-hydroxy-tetrahydrodipicolinate synthase
VPPNSDTLKNAHGVYTICPTPFQSDGSLDLGSIASLVDFQVSAGVTGLAVLGFLGEAHKLSNAERRTVADRFVRCAAGRVPVWVGVRALGTAGAIEQAREAAEVGAAAVFAAPLDNASDAVQFNYYQSLAAALPVPVVIHDFPDSFGTEITSEVIARLGREGGVGMIKMEEPPVGQKITRIRELAGDRLRLPRNTGPYLRSVRSRRPGGCGDNLRPLLPADPLRVPAENRFGAAQTHLLQARRDRL